MKTIIILFFLVVLTYGCSDSEKAASAMKDLQNTCNGETIILLHFGTYNRYIEVSCREIKDKMSE